MKPMLSAQTGDPENLPYPSAGIPESIYPDHHEINITDGGEFLDDAIRMKDQPFGETTEKEKDKNF